MQGIIKEKRLIIMDAQKVGSKIAELRKKRNMTQQQLADEISVTNKAVSKWETGGGLPDISILPALASVLGVSVDEIISDPKEANSNTDIINDLHGDSQRNKRYLKKPTLLTSAILVFILTVAVIILMDYMKDDVIPVPDDMDEGISVLYMTSSSSSNNIYPMNQEELVEYEKLKVMQIRDNILKNDDIKECNVFVKISTDSPFVKSQNEPTAEVHLTFIDGIVLSSSQTQDIVQIIKNYVPGIKNENIIITDSDADFR